MTKNKEIYETISIDLNPELVRLLNSKAKDIDNDRDGSDLLQTCIQTGLRLGEINTIFRKKMIEESAFEKQLVEAYGERSKSVDHVSKDLERIRKAEDGDESKIENIGHDILNLKKDFKTLKVRVNQDFYQEIKNASEKLGVEISTFVRFCIRTGMYLEDLNTYLQNKKKEE